MCSRYHTPNSMPLLDSHITAFRLPFRFLRLHITAFPNLTSPSMHRIRVSTLIALRYRLICTCLSICRILVILKDQIGYYDGVCKCNAGIGSNNNCDGGCCCCLADFDVAGCCLGVGDVGFCRNWNVGCGDLLREVVVTRSAVVDVVRGVSSGGIRSEDGSEVVEMWLRDNEAVEEDKRSEIVEVVLSVDDDEQSVNEAKRPSIDDMIINVGETQTNIQVNVSDESMEVQTVKEIVVMENVDDEQSVDKVVRLLETEATDDHNIAESAVSQKDTGSHCSNEGADYRKEIEICDDGEQAQFEVKEAFVTDQLKVIFPATFVRLDLNIRFGSFGQSGDSDSVFRVSEPETEPECGANINSHEPVLIDVQEDDKNMTFEGVDYLNDGANITNHEPILIDLQEHDKNATCEGVGDLDDGANINNYEPVLIDLQDNDKHVTCDDLDDGANINNHEPVLIDLQDNDKSVDDLYDGQQVGDPINVQTEEDELPPFYYLVKIPQSEDKKLNEQIKSAQLQLDEKTRRRDAISAEHDIKRENLMVHNEAFKAKILELRAARQLVESKRQQIDDTERIINKVNNAIAVEDIDKRLFLVGIALVVDYHLALWFMLTFLVIYLFTQQPPYMGLGSSTQLTPLQLESLLTEGGTSRFWLVEFRSSFSSSCIRISRVLPELSITFSNKNISFGVFDLGLFPNTAARFEISLGVPDELPTYILFENEQEISRFPEMHSSTKASDITKAPNSLSGR